jgi:hypothetical protein
MLSAWISGTLACFDSSVKKRLNGSEIQLHLLKGIIYNRDKRNFFKQIGLAR